MIILITGASHTGKTLLAQRMLEKYKYPYLSVDHLKMGLIRSGNTGLTAENDDTLTEYLWPIVREIIKTAAENNQNMIVEGCYIPPDWRQAFDDVQRKRLATVQIPEEAVAQRISPRGDLILLLRGKMLKQRCWILPISMRILQYFNDAV